MTSTQANIRSAAVGGIITLVGSALLMILTGAWSSKEDVADHKSDIQAIHADFRRVLDLLCTDHPAAQQCRTRGDLP